MSLITLPSTWKHAPSTRVISILVVSFACFFGDGLEEGLADTVDQSKALRSQSQIAITRLQLSLTENAPEHVTFDHVAYEVDHRTRKRTVRRDARARATAERRCYSLVQGKIRWNYDGATKWNPDNAKRLCRGTARAAEPGRCFRHVMHGGVNWGNGTKWQWKNALRLCAGTNSAKHTVRCFSRNISAGTSWQKAIPACSRKHVSRG